MRGTEQAPFDDDTDDRSAKSEKPVGRLFWKCRCNECFILCRQRMSYIASCLWIDSRGDCQRIGDLAADSWCCCNCWRQSQRIVGLLTQILILSLIDIRAPDMYSHAC